MRKKTITVLYEYSDRAVDTFKLLFFYDKKTITVLYEYSDRAVDMFKLPIFTIKKCDRPVWRAPFWGPILGPHFNTILKQDANMSEFGLPFWGPF